VLWLIEKLLHKPLVQFTVLSLHAVLHEKGELEQVQVHEDIDDEIGALHDQ